MQSHTKRDVWDGKKTEKKKSNVEEASQREVLLCVTGHRSDGTVVLDTES